jgi:hypothetical protein
MTTFEQMIENLEMAVEDTLRHEDAFRSDRAGVILDRLVGVQNAIDDWRQG